MFIILQGYKNAAGKSSVTLFEIDPLTDVRWKEFVESHPAGGVFHGTGWLLALAETYGYRPYALTTTPPGHALTDGIAFCEVRSWITGRRCVSLPFTDCCPLLVRDTHNLRVMLAGIRVAPRFAASKFFEIRDTRISMGICSDLCDVSARYVHHTLSLEPPLENIYRQFHGSCVQRKIRRAEKEGLRIESGCSDLLIRHFYRLVVQTRRRHGLPPQPLNWFQNLASTMGEQMSVKIAFHGDAPVSGIVTFRDSRIMTYKYGASDPKWLKLGGAPLLIWAAISEAKTANLSLFDFGRSDVDDIGLIQFKDRFGAMRIPLVYSRISNYPVRHEQIMQSRCGGITRKLFRILPIPVLKAVGRIIYRHVG